MTKKGTLVLIGFCILLVGAYFAERFYFARQPKIYPNFGIQIPAGYTTHGIDVSRYQKRIDWDMVSKMTDQGQKISFAIIKATEGTNSKDPYFERNWEDIQEYPILRGAYLYFHPNRSGKDQAAFFMKNVALVSGDLPPVIDIEESNGVSNATIRKALKECADVFEAAYHRKPIIYSNVDFYEKKLGEDFDDYPFWAAHYEQCNEPRVKRNWLIWQHNCKGRVNGIDAEVDFNVVNGSLFALSNICIE